jgi:hypothetical protein
MSVLAEMFTAVPIPMAATVVILRFGPSALVTLLAGAVAVLTRRSEQGERAVTVLRLLRSRPQNRARRPGRHAQISTPSP